MCKNACTPSCCCMPIVLTALSVLQEEKRLAQERADMELAMRLENEQASQDEHRAKGSAPQGVEQAKHSTLQGVEPQQPEAFEETVGSVPACQFEHLGLA